MNISILIMCNEFTIDEGLYMQFCERDGGDEVNGTLCDDFLDEGIVR
jgi:hypothetical protein